MRIQSFLFVALLSLSAVIGCKQKPAAEAQPADQQKTVIDTSHARPSDNITPKSLEAPVQTNRNAVMVSPSEATPALWNKIEIHINTSAVKDDATMKEVMTVMGKDWHYSITELWFYVQFNKKKKLSTGVKNLTEANFDNQYDREYDIAIRGGY